MALATLSRHRWLFFVCKVSRLDIAVCFSLGLERFPYFCPRPSVILGFRVHIFLVIWLCFRVLHSLRLQTLREQLLAVFFWRYFEPSLGGWWRATGVRQTHLGVWVFRGTFFLRSCCCNRRFGCPERGRSQGLQLLFGLRLQDGGG